MSTDASQPDEQAAAERGGGVLDVLHGLNWPGAVALVALVALFAVGPKLGVNPQEVATGVGAILAAYGLHHAKKANRQTNGSLTARMDAAVQRGTAELRAELPDLIRQALDTAPKPDPWAGDAEYPPK